MDGRGAWRAGLNGPRSTYCLLSCCQHLKMLCGKMQLALHVGAVSFFQNSSFLAMRRLTSTCLGSPSTVADWPSALKPAPLYCKLTVLHSCPSDRHATPATASPHALATKAQLWTGHSMLQGPPWAICKQYPHALLVLMLPLKLGGKHVHKLRADVPVRHQLASSADPSWHSRVQIMGLV